MNKYLMILAGLVLFLAPIYAWIIDLWGFGTSALHFLKGGVVWALILIGFLMLVAGLNELKD